MIARLLTELGHPTRRPRRPEQFHGPERPAIHRCRRSADRPRICRPNSTTTAPRQARARCAKGIEAVAGAVDFVRSLPPNCQRRSPRRARRAGSGRISTISAWRTCSGPHLQRQGACRARQARARPLSPRRAALGVDDRPNARSSRIRRSGRPARSLGATVIGLAAGRALLRRPRRHAPRARRPRRRAQL